MTGTDWWALLIMALVAIGLGLFVWWLAELVANDPGGASYSAYVTPLRACVILRTS